MVESADGRYLAVAGVQGQVGFAAEAAPAGGGGGGNDARHLANLKVVFSRNKDFKFWCKITLFSKG